VLAPAVKASQHWLWVACTNQFYSFEVSLLYICGKPAYLIGLNDLGLQLFSLIVGMSPQYRQSCAFRAVSAIQDSDTASMAGLYAKHLDCLVMLCF